ncbi:MAG: hypothetical protein EHM45_19200 [Desulfobacteraceae bacterium]|nr:MAG: hypothetical protein EHM45_19200 [Desulfobacteraceae bacterium]
MIKNKLEKFKSILPLYLRGDLSDPDRKELEEALIQYPELKKDLREFAEIRAAYQETIREMPEPAENLYGRIVQNIRKQENKAPRPYRIRVRSVLDFLQEAFASPKLAWTTAAVFLLISVAVVLKPAPEGTIVTLGQFDPEPYKVKLNIVFKDGASEKEIRKLLIGTGTRFIDGPDENGLYVLTVQSVDQKEKALAELEKSGIVRFVDFRE